MGWVQTEKIIEFYENSKNKTVKKQMVHYGFDITNWNKILKYKFYILFIYEFLRVGGVGSGYKMSNSTINQPDDLGKVTWVSLTRLLLP